MARFSSYVNPNNIQANGNATLNDRYYLELSKAPPNDPNGNNPDTAIVILKNPASTVKSHFFYNIPYPHVYDVDTTTTHIINILFGGVNGIIANSYNRIIILNLFPYYDNYPAALNAVYAGMNNNNYQANPSLNANLNEIHNQLTINNNYDLYLAWGQNSGVHKAIYDNTINAVIDLIQPNGNLLANINHVYIIQNGQQIVINNQVNNYRNGQFPPHGSKW